jgi:hypothetical protein
MQCPLREISQSAWIGICMPTCNRENDSAVSFYNFHFQEPIGEKIPTCFPYKTALVPWTFLHYVQHPKYILKDNWCCPINV